VSTCNVMINVVFSRSMAWRVLSTSFVVQGHFRAVADFDFPSVGTSLLLICSSAVLQVLMGPLSVPSSLINGDGDSS